MTTIVSSILGFLVLIAIALFFTLLTEVNARKAQSKVAAIRKRIGKVTTWPSGQITTHVHPIHAVAFHKG